MDSKKKLDLLLEVLSDSDWHWGDELAVKVSWRFGATIHDARRKGYSIEHQQVGVSHCYRLLKFSTR